MADILERIVNESYRPLFQGFLERPSLKFTLNINAGLTDQLLARGYQDVIDTIRTLALRGQCEMTESAKYHPFLPMTPRDEILRQIELNRETNRRAFGDAYHPEGFFPPEMAYNRPVADIAAESGFKWILLDEIAIPKPHPMFTDVPKIRGTSLSVLFRDRRISNIIMGAVVRTAASLHEALGTESDSRDYVLTAMDGETFGHHRPGHHAFLFEFLESVETIHVKDLCRMFPSSEEVEPDPSTWAATEEEIESGQQFLSWNNTNNDIHKKQWEFTHWAIDSVHALPSGDPRYAKARQNLDAALHSCQYWWASAKPWWSLEMIEAGAHRLKEVILANPDHTREDAARAQQLYQDIVLTAFEWQRTGYIRKLHKDRSQEILLPLKERGKEVEVQGLLAFLRIQMEKAAKKNEYEQAILWRDAIHKIEKKLDMYDAIHVIDLLRTRVPHHEIEDFLASFKTKFERMRSGQPERRD